MRAFGWIVGGLAVAALVAALIGPQDGYWSDGEDRSTPAPPSDDHAMLMERIDSLETSVAELVAEIEVLRLNVVDDTAASPLQAPAFPTRPAEDLPPREASNVPASFFGTSFSSFDKDVEILVAGGLTPQRAEWIRTRIDEFTMEYERARYEAELVGERPPTPDNFDAALDLALRNELGDTEFEQYLEATRRSTGVLISSVLPGSAAAQAGLKRADQIVSYDGRRIFHMRELSSLILDGTPGEPIIVELERGGSGRFQVIVPRGPLGVDLTPLGVPVP